MATSAERMRRKRERDKAAGLVEVKIWVPTEAAEQIKHWADSLKHEWLARQERAAAERQGQMRLPGLEEMLSPPPKKTAPSRPKKAKTEPSVTADVSEKPARKRRAKKEDRQA